MCCVRVHVCVCLGVDHGADKVFRRQPLRVGRECVVCSDVSQTEATALRTAATTRAS